MNVSPIVMFIGVAGLAWLTIESLERLFSPWIAKRRVAKLLADVNAGRVPKKSGYDHEILFDEKGFSIVKLKESNSTPLAMNWIEVCNATAFKRDLFSVDLVCLFLSRHDGFGLELDEDMKGWKEFIAALPSYLPACKAWEKWFMEVAYPAFATNKTEIFSRRQVQPDNLIQST